MNKEKFFKYGFFAFLIISISVFAFNYMNSKSSDSSTTTLPISSLVSKNAPDFTLPSSNGGTVSLSDYRGKKNVLLYFQEGVMCDPCWQQTLDIQKKYDKFQSQDIELVTITVDPLNAVTKNANRFGITLPVLADEDLSVSTQYDVLKNSMHPGERPGHTFILLDNNGKVIWRKDYFLASGSTKMTMRMSDGSTMTMDMGMDMGKPGSVMYVNVDKLLSDIKSASLNLESSSSSTSSMDVSNPEMTMQDHSMCLTPIHNHVDFKMYLGETMLNFSQKSFMDQANFTHFHKTVKVNPDDVPGIPNGLLIHVHRDNVTIRDFLKTLDLPFNIDNIQNLKVVVNDNVQSSGLDYVLKDKDRLLVTGSSNNSQIKSQMDSVTDYALQGKEKNPSLFGGC
jgi:peroxiredoxin Q/BCP